MARPHAKLRGALLAADIDGPYLARKLQRGSDYVSKCLMGHKPWTIAECYTILDLLHIPHTQLPEYFPPKGA